MEHMTRREKKVGLHNQLEAERVAVSRPFLPLMAAFGEPKFIDLFSASRTVAAWLDVEVALARAQALHGVIPRSAADRIERELRSVEIDHVLVVEGSRKVGYPILPFLEQLVQTDPQVASYVHFGATTQDIMDTALVLQLRGACDEITATCVVLGDALATLAVAERNTVMAGRTHGQQAVPITFGMKVAGWLEEVRRGLVRLDEARGSMEVIQLYGAAGTSAAFGPMSTATRKSVAEILGLGCDDMPWHSVRDRLFGLISALVVLGSATGRIAREIVDLARNEIGEVQEAEGRLSGASSTMPQKANPVLSEAIVGLSEMACTLSAAPLRAMTGRHERPAGEWQMEWDSVPLIVMYAGSALSRGIDLIEGLRVNRERMKANLDVDGGLLMAEALMMKMAPLIGRSEAHELIYDLVGNARVGGVSLAHAVRPILEEHGVSEEFSLDGEEYLGEAEAIVSTAVGRWYETGGDRS